MTMRKFLSTMAALSFILLFAAQARAADFSDVPDVHLNREAISTLRDQGVLQGYPSGDYLPENRVNRVEFVKILAEAVYSDAEIDRCSVASHVKFSDTQKDAWYAKTLCLAKAKGLIDGYPDGTFRPAEFITLVEAAKIMAEAFGLPQDFSGTEGEWFAGYIKALESKKAIPTTVDAFDRPLTRGEMAEFIWRLETSPNKLTATYSSLSQPLPRFGSCQALQERFDQYWARQRYPMPYLSASPVDELMSPVMEDAANGAPAPSSAVKSESAANYSQTNVQVAGVDEADTIKNDGKYIYMVSNATVRIVEAYPASGMKELTRLEFEEGFWPQELYVDGDRLAVIGNASSYDAQPLAKEGGIVADAKMIWPGYYSQRTQVYVFDISDRSAPKTLRKVSYQGYALSTRRVEGRLYLVLNSQPQMWGADSVPTAESLLPVFQDGQAEPQKMADCSQIGYFPGHQHPNYMMAVSMPMEKEGAIEREVLLGSGDMIYSSAKSLYVAAQSFAPWQYADWDWSRDQVRTHAYKFALEKDGGIAFAGRGIVPGTPLNQFAMDEAADGEFRIATTQGNTWDDSNPSSNNVYILDAGMKRLGQLEGVAPGERIYSTRFMGDRLYMVTFRQTDPLFVIDLANGRLPRILGQLKIPGFSNYLHPYDANHLIGFGMDTSEDAKGNVTLGGMKLSLFDVTDVKNPVQKFAEVIGDQGTYSELLYNHKALLFDKAKSLLAFPIQIYEKVQAESSVQCGSYTYSQCPAEGCVKQCVPTGCSADENGVKVCTSDCDGANSCVSSQPDYPQYEPTFAGAVVYSLDLQNGFAQRGQLTHYTEADWLLMGDYFPYDYLKQIQRLVTMGDTLYTVAQGGVMASALDTLKKLSFITLNQ